MTIKLRDISLFICLMVLYGCGDCMTLVDNYIVNNGDYLLDDSSEFIENFAYIPGASTTKWSIDKEELTITVSYSAEISPANELVQEFPNIATPITKVNGDVVYVVDIKEVWEVSDSFVLHTARNK